MPKCHPMLCLLSSLVPSLFVTHYIQCMDFDWQLMTRVLVQRILAYNSTFEFRKKPVTNKIHKVTTNNIFVLMTFVYVCIIILRRRKIRFYLSCMHSLGFIEDE